MKQYQTQSSILPAMKTFGEAQKKQASGTVAVVGLGYVGLPLALLCAAKKYQVIGFDTDKEKIKKLNARLSPFSNPQISKDLLQTSARFFGTPERMKDADVVVVCVPTPVHEDHAPDLEPLIHAVETVGSNMSRGALIIIESTINPGVCESIVVPLLEKRSGLKAGVDFDLSHCPERINPGDERWNLGVIPRVVGSLTPSGLRRTVSFYSSIINAPIRSMRSLKEAEAVKVVENSFRDVNIAFVNELAMSFSKLGIDIVNVIEGASTKPFSFMAHYPGCGVGGHCIPVDPYYLIEYGRQNGFEHLFLSTARKINDQMPVFTVELAQKLLSQKGLKLSGSQVTLLGLSYKADIDDMRESPAVKILEELKRRGARTVVYDPYQPSRSNAQTISGAVMGSVAVILATAHSEFNELDGEFLAERGVKVFVDGRNRFSRERFALAGVSYSGIGH